VHPGRFVETNNSSRKETYKLAGCLCSLFPSLSPTLLHTFFFPLCAFPLMMTVAPKSQLDRNSGLAISLGAFFVSLGNSLHFAHRKEGKGGAIDRRKEQLIVCREDNRQRYKKLNKHQRIKTTILYMYIKTPVCSFSPGISAPTSPRSGLVWSGLVRESVSISLLISSLISSLTRFVQIPKRGKKKKKKKGF